jgi:hypothetical protein
MAVVAMNCGFCASQAAPKSLVRFAIALCAVLLFVVNIVLSQLFSGPGIPLFSGATGSSPRCVLRNDVTNYQHSVFRSGGGRLLRSIGGSADSGDVAGHASLLRRLLGDNRDSFLGDFSADINTYPLYVMQSSDLYACNVGDQPKPCLLWSAASCHATPTRQRSPRRGGRRWTQPSW